MLSAAEETSSTCGAQRPDFTSDEKRAVLRRFEPIVRYTRGEQFFPMDVERYLAESSLWVAHPGKADRELVSQGSLSPAELADGPNVDVAARSGNRLVDGLARLVHLNRKRPGERQAIDPHNRPGPGRHQGEAGREQEEGARGPGHLHGGLIGRADASEVGHRENEIADVMGLTVQAVKSRLHRARQQMVEVTTSAGVARSAIAPLSVR